MITNDIIEIRRFMDSIKPGTLIIHNMDIKYKLPRKDALGYCNWQRESLFWLEEI